MRNYVRSKESVIIILDGETYTVAADHPQYAAISAALDRGDWTAVEAMVKAKQTVIEVLGKFGEVEITGDKVTWRGIPVHNYLVQKILERPNEIEPLGHFLDNVMRNPDPRAREDLFRWVEAGNMPITTDGQVLAYKYVKDDFFDAYSGTVDHHPGNIPAMRREDCDPDPNRTCSRGLHFCSRSYLGSYGSGGHKLLKLKVNPADVVAFPTDYGLSKGRACRYEVIEEIDWETEFDSAGYAEAVRPLAVGDKVRLLENDRVTSTADVGRIGEVTAVDFDRTYSWSGIYDGQKGCVRVQGIGSDTFWYPISILERVEEDDGVRYRIKDCDGDYIDIDEDGDWMISDSRTYTDAEAKAAVDRYQGYCEPLTIEKIDDGRTILDRIITIEEVLHLDGEGSTFPERLDAIERELGFEPIEPLIARIERAESQLGLS